MTNIKKNLIELKLDKKYKSSIYENIVINEYINIKNVKYFIQNNLGINYKGIKRYEDIKFNNEKEQMTKYLNKYDKENKIFKVKIFLAKHKWGRVVYEDQTSISIFHRPTRHTYCKDKYIDIDIVNSAPSIIYEILKMNGIIKNNFKYYIDNRDEIIKEIMNIYDVSKDVSKKLFLILMHGGSYNCWKYENKINDNNKELPKIVKDIISDLESIIDIIYSHNKNVISIKDKWKNTEEEKKGIFSLWYQTIEKNIQETMISYLVNNKGLILNDIIPCQDGFMILKDFYYENILYDCQNEILNNYGINIKLKIKEFDEIIEIGEYDGGLLINDFKFLRTNTDFLEHLYNCDEFSNKIYKEDEKTYYYYNKDTTIFEPTTTQDIRQITSKYVLDLLRDNETMIDSKILQKYENKYGNDMRNILKDYKINKDCHKIFNKLLCFIPIKDNKIIYIGEERCKIYNDETIFESNEIFKNIEGKIYEKNEIFDRTEFFKFNYVSDVDYIENLSTEEYIFCKKYFDDIFCDKTETVKTVLNILKTSMSGIVLKYLFCCVGSKGNNGKSIFFDVMLKGIFGNMIDVLNKSIIIDTGVKSNLNTECEKLDKIKIGYVNEFSDTDIFNNTMIKTITGGDNLNLRTLQTKDNTLKPTCNLFINSNSLPKSAYNLDTALFNRIVIIPFDKTFENDITFKFKLKNKIDALFSYIIQNGKIVYENLELSEEMKSENNKYKDNNKKNSFLGDFIEERIEIIEGERINRDIFYDKYYEWCNEKNIKQNKIPFGTFSKIMNKDHGIKSGHSGLITYYSDIKFKI